MTSSGLPACFVLAGDRENITASLWSIQHCLLSETRHRSTQIIVLFHSISLYSTWFLSNSLALPFESEMRAFKPVKYVRKLSKEMDRNSVGAFLSYRQGKKMCKFKYRSFWMLCGQFYFNPLVKGSTHVLVVRGLCDPEESKRLEHCN